MKIGVIIPTINRVDLLEECLVPLLKYKDVFDKILIIDNGNQDFSKIRDKVRTEHIIKIYSNEKNLGVAGSWNLGITKLREKCDWFLILNDDIVISEKTISQLKQKLKDEESWVLRGSYSYSCFLLNKESLSQMEYKPDCFFDEMFFPAYCEDVDFEYRIRLIDDTKIKKNLQWIDLETYRRKGSSEKNPELRQYRKMREYFKEKWGGGPRNPQFKTPFGGKKPWPSGE